MDFMEILFLALGAFLLFGSDLIVGIMSLKSLGDRKAKTGLYHVLELDGRCKEGDVCRSVDHIDWIRSLVGNTPIAFWPRDCGRRGAWARFPPVQGQEIRPAYDRLG